jgi:methyl-accepting chemotaxis protein
MSEDMFDRHAMRRNRARLEKARTSGSWIPWAGASLALLYWAGVAAWLYVTLGVGGIAALPPMLLAGGAAALFVPGVALIVAGVMARESARSAQANSVVLAAARLLLEPAEDARDGIATIAEALTEMRARMDGLRHDIENSVVGALKAAEIVRADSEVLVHKMSAERQGLAQLSETLRGQSEDIARAVPRYAQTMTEAARLAQAEVTKADATLEQRLQNVEEAAQRLGERIGQLDTMGAESRKRAQNLAASLARMDEQLVQSTRMVDAAVRAGELATAASKSTADSLRDAMSDALDSALKASETIAAQSAAASEDARGALVRLKEVGLQVEATTRSASLAARGHADEAEHRIRQVTDLMSRVPAPPAALPAAPAPVALPPAPPVQPAVAQPIAAQAPAPQPFVAQPFVAQPFTAQPPADIGLEKARQRIEHASTLVKQIKSADSIPAPNDSSVEDLWLDPTSTATRPEPFRPAATKPTASGAAVASHAHASSPDFDFDTAMRQAGAPEEAIFTRRAGPSSFPSSFPPSFRAAAAPASPPPIQPTAFSAIPPSHPMAAPSRNATLSWRDLLTGIDDGGPAQREETASTVIDHLNRAGVRLTNIVRAADLRRIATASHQGERQRRRAIRDVVPAEIQRVSRLIDADADLQQAARTFVAVEEPDALRVLASAERAREDAAPRLSAYLLLDAALGTMI